ncbi:Na+/H+ antiporter NhaC family protein [Nocardiopsis mangrovi]|uniref:Na+/H+ antiporter NhaC family protein n=1 Tax=Nocardiopsis mangrovi TaxID=1179818 RepID=A0ABV9DWX7_9ACTN
MNSTTVPARPDGAETSGQRIQRRLIGAATAGMVIGCVAVGFVSDGPTAWGLLPIVLYTLLCLWGVNILLATVAALLSAFAILQPSPLDAATVLTDGLADNVTAIGLISVLGAGLGEVLRTTGVASLLVRGVMRVMGEKSGIAVIIGMMAASLITVAMLGTVGGSLAIIAPILIPIAARMGITRATIAVIFLYAGCAGLALGPFAGSNIAIMEAAEVSYGQYLLHGAIPLALLSVTVGYFIILWVQKRSFADQDFYSEAETVGDEPPPAVRSRFATGVFVAGLVAFIAYAMMNEASTALPLLALPSIALLTALAAGQSLTATVTHFCRGAGAYVHLFLLFWMLATMFALIDRIDPFTPIFDAFGGQLSATSPFAFSVLVGLVGLIGVPGASAAVVVLVDQVFGDAAAATGISPAAWIVVLLFASKGDTYGPFPNPNMVTCMGMARYDRLRFMLLSGWMLLIPAALMYTAILFFIT